MIGILGEDIFNDTQQKYYITIDALDEEWADDRIRYKMIKSLIETVSSFRTVSNVEIILALRQDLLDKVLHSSHVGGFQEEKFQSLYLKLKWSKKALIELVDKRIDFMVKRRYTNSTVSSKDVFTANVDGLPALDYMLARTFYRPRDIILFVNECLDLSEDVNHITASVVKKAEEEYSYGRLQSLATEWLKVYPNLAQVASMFSGLKSNFLVREISEEFLTNRYIEVAQDIEDSTIDPLTKRISILFDSKSVNYESIRTYILKELFLIGLFGVKVDARSTCRWSTDTRTSIGTGQIKASSRIYVHPMFYRALSIQDS